MATARRRRRRGTGGIIERANGRFIARVSLGVVDGKRRRLERKGFRSRAEAEVALASLRGAADLDDRTPLAAYLAAWLDGMKPALAPRSHRAYGDDIRLHVSPTLGGVTADTLGHSSPSITARVYAHVVPALAVEAADRLDAVLRRTSG